MHSCIVSYEFIICPGHVLYKYFSMPSKNMFWLVVIVSSFHFYYYVLVYTLNHKISIQTYLLQVMFIEVLWNYDLIHEIYPYR